MRKISLVAAIALMLAGVGVWATSTIQARIAVPASAQIDPLQITKDARHLPDAHYDGRVYEDPRRLAVPHRRSRRAAAMTMGVARCSGF